MESDGSFRAGASPRGGISVWFVDISELGHSRSALQFLSVEDIVLYSVLGSHNQAVDTSFPLPSSTKRCQRVVVLLDDWS